MTLYRKYRPQTFADFVNQKPIKQTIINQILQNKVAHAYLFTGPRGVGKTTMARLLSKSLNCENRSDKDFEPCDKCQSCLEIKKGISLDLDEKDAASNRGIDEIRTLRNNVRFAPTRSKYKIFIIDEVHMLTTPAFNALLKTLEEPPENTIFILATTEPHKLPETIISRCQRFDFKKVNQKEMVEHLSSLIKKENIKVSAEILKNIAIRSEGCLRDAQSILGQILTLGTDNDDKEITWEDAELVIPRSNHLLIEQFAEELVNNNAKEAVLVVGKLIEEGVDLEQFTLDLIDYAREKMIASVSTGDSSKANYYSQFLDIFVKRFGDLKQSSYLPQLPLELGVLDVIAINFKSKNSNLKTTTKNLNLSIVKKKVEDSKDEIEISQNEPRESNKDDIRKDQPIDLEPKTNLNQDDSTLTLETIKTKWPEVLKRIRGHNHSLPVALSSCQPLRLDGNKLILGFKFKLHYNVLSNIENRTVLEKLLEEVFQNKLMVEGEVVEGIELNAGSDESAELESTVSEVKEVFGE